MREILFRGWDKQRARWWYGSAVFIPQNRCCIHCWDGGEVMGYLVDPESVGQYTGIKDVTGNKIFEGDILKDEEEYLSAIYWGEEDCMWCATDVGGMCDLPLGGKIVGNVYENPELLKQN